MYNVRKIEHEMRRRAWTMLKLAESSGVSVSTVKRTFEVGSAHPETIRKMAQAVGLTMDDLLPQPVSPKRKRDPSSPLGAISEGKNRRKSA